MTQKLANGYSTTSVVKTPFKEKKARKKAPKKSPKKSEESSSFFPKKSEGELSHLPYKFDQSVIFGIAKNTFAGGLRHVTLFSFFILSVSNGKYFILVENLVEI